MKLFNQKGTIWYGMHFYSGIAEYKELGNLRVLVNEDTIRTMGPTFAGRPVFVQHKDEVNQDLDKLRAEADGWVVESFFNEADGKHWVKFLVCSEKGEDAIKKGYRLSNCYTPQSYGQGGECNGVPYNKEVMGGVYDHLAIVPNPRYEESVILTPEQFKEYNETKRVELTKLANNNGGAEVKIKLFRKVQVEKLENSAEIETLAVQLKSGREVTISQLVNEADAAEEKAKAPVICNGSDLVKVGDKTMTVDELTNAYNAAMSKNDDGETVTDDDLIVADAVPMNEADEDLENAEDDENAKADEDDDEKPVEDAKKVANDKKPAKKTPSDEDKAKAARLRLANQRGNREDYASTEPTFDPTAKVQRGIQRYGS